MDVVTVSKNNGRMVSMTYGVLPTWERFKQAFDNSTIDGLYKVRNCKRVGDCNFTAWTLWNELEKIIESFNGSESEDIDWASCVLYTLGFEWI